MPKMIDPITGESEEISQEEFEEVMRRSLGGEGKMYIKQVTTDADGNQTVSSIYGNPFDLNDGLDRSVNVFYDDATFNALLQYAVKQHDARQSPDYNKAEDPGYDADDMRYVMTLDVISTTVTFVLTIDEKQVSLCAYLRDERKSNREELWKTVWDVDADTNIIRPGDGSDNDDFLRLFVYLEIRRILRKNGDIKRLKALENRGTGVIVTARGDGSDVSTRIVQGRNRPDLMCNVFLIGEQMMRPYPDELFTELSLIAMTEEAKIQEAENGNPDAMESLAKQYLIGDDEVVQNFEKSAYWWQQLANADNAIGQFNIGLHYAKGCGVERDFDKAAMWMKKAADNGDEDALGAYKTYAEAAENLKKAEQGDAHAQAEISLLFTRLAGSLKEYDSQNDYAEAFKWAQKSADQGDLDGMYNLALCYSHGRGTEVDKAKAVSIYAQATKLGHIPSQWNLAVNMIDGVGCERDPLEGYTLAYQAAATGYDLAIDNLNRIEKSVGQLIEFFDAPDCTFPVEGTQYEGRADRCENLVTGTALTYKNGIDKNNQSVIELFYQGKSIGHLPRTNRLFPLQALLNLDMVTMQVMVDSCEPKSQRGPRARSAYVAVRLHLMDKSSGAAESVDPAMASPVAKAAEPKAPEKRRYQPTNSTAKEICEVCRCVLSDGKVHHSSDITSNNELCRKKYRLVNLALEKMCLYGELYSDLFPDKNTYYATTKEALAEAKLEMEKAREQKRIAAENAEKDRIYSGAVSALQSADKDAIRKAISDLETIRRWKDSSDKITALENRIVELDRQAEEEAIRQAEAKKRNARIAKIVGIAVAIIAVIAVVAVVLMGNQQKQKTYQQALSSIETDDTVAAVIALNEISGYQDSQELLDGLIAENGILAATIASVGDAVVFGSYNDADIEWVVVGTADNTVYLLSQTCLEDRQFNSTGGEEAELVEWVATEFAEEAFDESELAIIQTVGLLSKDQIKEFSISKDILKTGHQWWLADVSFYSKTNKSYLVKIVLADGTYTTNASAATETKGVRPLVTISW